MSFPLKILGILRAKGPNVMTFAVGHTSGWTTTLRMLTSMDDVIIDWGDGSALAPYTQNSSISHVYTAGDYNVRVYTFSDELTFFYAQSSRVKSLDFSQIKVNTTDFRVNSNSLLSQLILGNFANKFSNTFFAYSCGWTVLNLSKAVIDLNTYFWVGVCPSLTQIILSSVGNKIGGNALMNSNVLFINGLNNADISYYNGLTYDVSNDNLTATAINRELVNIDNDGVINGTFTGGGTNAAPDGSSGGFDGLTAKANLISKGWTVTTN